MVVSHLLCSEAEASSSSESQNGTHNSLPQVCLERMQNESRANAMRAFVHALSSPRAPREGAGFDTNIKLGRYGQGTLQVDESLARIQS